MPACGQARAAHRHPVRSRIKLTRKDAAAGGDWIQVAFGWMSHVYPNGKSQDDVWFGR